MASKITTETYTEAREPLLAAIRRHIVASARFEVSSGNYDRPRSETPWLERYGNEKYDARWYAVMGAKDHAVEGLSQAIDSALRTFWAIAYLEGAAGTEETNG